MPAWSYLISDTEPLCFGCLIFDQVWCTAMLHDWNYVWHRMIVSSWPFTRVSFPADGPVNITIDSLELNSRWVQTSTVKSHSERLCFCSSVHRSRTCGEVRLWHLSLHSRPLRLMCHAKQWQQGKALCFVCGAARNTTDSCRHHETIKGAISKKCM